jgi:2-methylcitrate dehydratase PrpD
MSAHTTSSRTRELLEPLLDPQFGRSPVVLDAARRLLLDHVAVAAWGARSEVATTMREHVLADLARDRGATLPVIGADVTCSAVEASMANAVAAACFEFDDTHTGASAHPGAVVFPAALAAAAISGCGEARFLHAVAVGYEVLCRVAMASNPHAHRARHFHPTSTAGHFGAAAAAAICLDLDLDRAVAALALSGTVAGGSMQFLVEGAITKQLHPAYAVQRGVQAALLAGRGFPGLADPIAGTRGFLAAQSDDPRPERLLAGLGTEPAEITRTGIKPYPSCRNTQTPVDALLALLAEHPVDPADVESITFGLIRTGLTTVWEPPERTRRPRTLADAQFSMPFVAAVTLLDGRLEAAQFAPDRYRDPAVLALMDVTECVGDPELDAGYPAGWPAWVQVRTTSGAVWRARADSPRGDPANPLGDDDLAAKLAQLTDHQWDAARRGQVSDAIAALPTGGGQGWLERLTGRW